MRYVLYGVKGSGMAAITHILMDKDYEVIGIDTNNYVYTEDDLIQRGLKIYNFKEYQFTKDDILIFGHSFNRDEEVLKAKEICLKVYEYHEFLNELVRKSRLSIAVAGSHGKTYTTGLISYLLNKSKKVSYLIGDGEGKYNGDDIFVFEACEYQDHFLIYKPDICIVLNIDYDHVDYFKNKEQYLNSFKKFINNSKLAIINYNDQYLSKINSNNVIYYDINKLNDIKLLDSGYQFVLNNIVYSTNVFGIKHVENILAVIELFNHLKIDNRQFKDYLSTFSGVKRRFREIIINGDIYIDDYAHHHSQIKYTLEMVKNKYPDYEMIVFFKPDRPSRFLTFYKQIATSLEQANYVVIMDFPSCNFDANINLLVNENKNKFYLYSNEILKKIRSINKKVVVSLGSKNMREVYENIFINTYL